MTLLRTRTMVSGNFKKQLNLESYHKKNVKGIRVQNASNAQICGLQRAGVPTAMLVDKNEFCMAPCHMVANQEFGCRFNFELILGRLSPRTESLMKEWGERFHYVCTATLASRRLLTLLMSIELTNKIKLNSSIYRVFQ